MTVPSLQRDLIAHCIGFMSNKNAIKELFNRKNIPYPKGATYKKLVQAYEDNPDSLNLDDIRDLFRNKWVPCNLDRHIAHLQSGALNNHSWHGARPSMLHLSIQDKVRECCDGTIGLDKYLSMGLDIVKHEYFMVATHDICETSIIHAFPSVIPPIGSKSLSDFVFDGIPYDLKLTTHPDSWKPFAGKMTLGQKKQLAFELYEGADSERMRKAAEKCKHNWGLNRMYYVVNDQDKWLRDPQGTIQYLLDNLGDAGNFFDIVVHGFNIHICLIEQ